MKTHLATWKNDHWAPACGVRLVIGREVQGRITCARCLKHSVPKTPISRSMFNMNQAMKMAFGNMDERRWSFSTYFAGLK